MISLGAQSDDTIKLDTTFKETKNSVRDQNSGLVESFTSNKTMKQKPTASTSNFQIVSTVEFGNAYSAGEKYKKNSAVYNNFADLVITYSNVDNLYLSSSSKALIDLLRCCSLRGTTEEYSMSTGINELEQTFLSVKL